MSMPLAITPIVAGSAPSCAAPSIPRASPETTASPASASACAKSRASLTAAADALRAPTTATHGQDRGRAFDPAEKLGIAGHVVEQVARARRAHRADLVLDGVARGGPVVAAAARSEIGQRLERGLRGSEPPQQLGVRDRPDV